MSHPASVESSPHAHSVLPSDTFDIVLSSANGLRSGVLRTVLSTTIVCEFLIYTCLLSVQPVTHTLT
jgi:hypothetical protein